MKIKLYILTFILPIFTTIFAILISINIIDNLNIFQEKRLNKAKILNQKLSNDLDLKMKSLDVLSKKIEAKLNE